MLTETAVVVSASGNRAMVKTVRSEACSGCSAQGACHALGGGKEMRVEVLNYLRAGEGDRVELALPEGSFLKASVITYVIPLASILAGAIVGHVSGGFLGLSQNGAAILLSALGLGLSMPVVYKLNRRLGGDEQFIPRITRVLPAVAEAQPASCDRDGA